ncbi:SAVED domain-containing protein [Kocuria arenosa]|uniref:SAVED domain-containing protein n=1 Tax=Kocuria arenosa TaxID=3071446 RepID=UPI0034D52CA2
MSMSSPAAGPLSPSGVRRGGDHYQDLFVWAAAMRLVQRDSPFTVLEVEARGVGNVDDVVLRGRSGADEFGQVKWSSKAGALLDEDFMTSVRATRGTSLLQKLYGSYQKLRPAKGHGAHPTLQLITNRAADPGHDLLGHIDGRSDLLIPYAADQSSTSKAGILLAGWATHVEAERHELLEMLEHLRFTTGRTISGETERIQALMASVGLHSNHQSLEQGLSAAAAWVRNGLRTVTPQDVEKDIDRLGLQAGEPKAVLLVQAIDRDGHPEDATAALDWVDLFEGNAPRERTHPRDRRNRETMQQELEAAVQRLENAGWRKMVIRGAMRQATFFLVGAAAPRTRQWALSYMQRRGSEADHIWDTETPRVLVPQPIAQSTPVEAGNELAVVINFALDATPAVLSYVRQAGLQVREVMSLSPEEGAHDQSVAGSGEAICYVQHLINAVRRQIEQHPSTERVHLFLAGPGGLALLLGHRWNRVRATTVYEHLGTGAGYAPAFQIS